MSVVVVLCTGNAARSVMAGAALRAAAPDVRVTTAGTHVIDGQPQSWRTRDAMAEVGLADPAHRSSQLRPDELAEADLVIAMATEHVRWIRRHHPEAAGRTATLKRLRDALPPDGGDLRRRVDRLDLGEVELEEWEDIADPAGGEIEEFVACAREVRRLADEVAPLLRPPEAPG